MNGYARLQDALQVPGAAPLLIKIAKRGPDQNVGIVALAAAGIDAAQVASILLLPVQSVDAIAGDFLTVVAKASTRRLAQRRTAGASVP